MGYITEVLGQVGRALVTAEAVIVIASAVLGALAMFFVLSYLLEVAACWRIFEKAGLRGWTSLIPVYNSYVRYQLAWRPKWFWVSFLLQAASIALDLWGGVGTLWSTLAMGIWLVGAWIHLSANYRLGRVFGRGVLFSLALAVFPPLFTLILGFGGSEYQRKSGAATEALNGEKV